MLSYTMKPLMTTEDVAQATRLSTSTLRKMRMRTDGGGLRWVRIGRRCAYRTDDVEAFIAARVRLSTGPGGGAS